MTLINGTIEHNSTDSIYQIKLDLSDLISSLDNNNDINNHNNIDYSKFSYSGSLEDQPYKEIFLFKDGKFYLSYDGFSYFLIMLIVGIFLFKSFVKISKEFFILGFNFFKKGKS